MTRICKILALLLVLCMALSLTVTASGEASGGASGGASGSASIRETIGDQPILAGHVYIQKDAGDDLALFTVKGRYIYDESIAPGDSFQDEDDYAGILPWDIGEIRGASAQGYDGSEPLLMAMLAPGEGTDLTLILSGIAALGDNAAYAVRFTLRDGTVTEPAYVYIVTAENAAYPAPQTLTFPGLEDYALRLSDRALLQITEQQYGGSQGLFTADDFRDTAWLPQAEKDAVTWYLNSAVTNGGDNWFVFGYDAPYQRLEAVHFLYKLFTIEAGNGILGFTGDANPIGGGFNEFKFFSGNTTALHAFMLEGAFQSTGFGRIADGTYTPAGFDLLTTGMDRNASLLDGFKTVTGEDMLVMIYNALTGGYASLSPAGQALHDALIAEANVTPAMIDAARAAVGAYKDALFSEGDNWRGELMTKPNLAAILYTSNADKIAALAAHGIVCGNLGELTKGEAAALLYQLDGLQTYRSFFDNESVSGSLKDSLKFWWSPEDASYIGSTNGQAYYSADEADVPGEAGISGTDVTVRNGVWHSHPTAGNRDDAFAEDAEPADTALYIDGGVHAVLEDGLVVSAGNVRSDSEYKFGVGGGLVVHGAGTLAELRNTDGGLNIIGAGNYSSTVNMAGAVFTGMGAVTMIDHGQIFSYSQHPSNTCYSGAIIYKDSYMTGNSGRIFSTDFFGGYVIADRTVYDKSGINMYLDETSTLLCVDSFLPGLSGANTGISQAYFQDCLIYNVKNAFSFSNNTSMPDDVATGTFVNCDLHFADGSCSIATVSREQKALVSLTDTAVDMDEYAGGYMFTVTGDDFHIAASLMLELEGTVLPPEDVFVAGPRSYTSRVLNTVSTGEEEHIRTNGTSLYVKADAASAVTLRQKLDDTMSVNCYSAKKEGDGKYTVRNTGTISVFDPGADAWIATGLIPGPGGVRVLNPAYAVISRDGGLLTVTYTIGTVTVILQQGA